MLSQVQFISFCAGGVFGCTSCCYTTFIFALEDVGQILHLLLETNSSRTNGRGLGAAAPTTIWGLTLQSLPHSKPHPEWISLVAIISNNNSFVTAREYRSTAFRGSLSHCNTSPVAGSVKRKFYITRLWYLGLSCTFWMVGSYDSTMHYYDARYIPPKSSYASSTNAGMST